MPSKKQYAEVLARIAVDAKAVRVYLDDDGRTCVLGDLALQAGVPRRTLLAARDASIIPDRDSAGVSASAREAVKHIRTAITLQFGLSGIRQQRLQILNDLNPTVASRRASLSNAVRRWQAGGKTWS